MTTHIRRLRSLTGCAAAAVTLGTGLHLPRTYEVSTEPAVRPEGIAVTATGTMYVTSAATGAVYRGDVRDPHLHVFLPAGSDGRTAATGIHPDRSGRLFVCGWSTGTLYVYSPEGRLLAARPAPVAGAKLNDLVITADAVYVTDSATGILWRAALSGTTVGPLTAWLTPADFPAPPSYLNGVVASADGRLALVADQGTDQLLRVDLVDRTATLVTAVGGTMGADGLLLDGDHLYGVVNFADPDGSGYLFVVRLAALDAGWRTATVIATSGAEDESQTPTTIARDHGRLLWVNSQVLSAQPAPPYTVTEVPGLN